MPARILALALAATLLSPLPAAADAKAEQQALDIAKRAIAFRSVAGPGNQTPALDEYIKSVLVAGGFSPADITVTPVDDTAYLVARWRGSDAKAKPLVISGHLDVVEAERKDWTMEPFAFNEKDGFFYGRGTQDVKGGAATLVTALLRMRAEGITPARDLVLALTSGEEGSCPADPPYPAGCGMSNGVQWLLAHRKDLVDA